MLRRQLPLSIVLDPSATEVTNGSPGEDENRATQYRDTVVPASGPASRLSGASINLQIDSNGAGLKDVADRAEPGERIERLFGSRLFFRLWCSQAVSSLGDWIGFAALTALATRLGGTQQGLSVAIVIGVRLVPGIFLGSIAGLLVDKFNRKRIMVICDIGRFCVVATLPFVNAVWQLIIASFALEVFTLLWSPAKEAVVPNIVPESFLARANSLSLIAAYGMFVPGLLVFSVLARVAEVVGREKIIIFPVNDESLALYFDAFTYLASAVTLALLALPRFARGKQPRAKSEERSKRASVKATLREVRDGYSFITRNRIVRSIMLGVGTGLIGGGMVVPLGALFASDVLGGGTASFGTLEVAMGTGVGIGIFGLSLVLKRYAPEKSFVVAVLGAGCSIIGAASMSSTIPALVFIFGLGVCAGAVYVLGFTILQTTVTDDLRGRTFASLYVMARVCILLAFFVGPILADVLDNLSVSLFDRSVGIRGVDVSLQGVRLTLWIAGGIIIGAGFIARSGLRVGAHAAPVDFPRSARKEAAAQQAEAGKIAEREAKKSSKKQKHKAKKSENVAL